MILADGIHHGGTEHTQACRKNTNSHSSALIEFCGSLPLVPFLLISDD
jgi:hypothetical protein